MLKDKRIIRFTEKSHIYHDDDIPLAYTHPRQLPPTVQTLTTITEPLRETESRGLLDKITGKKTSKKPSRMELTMDIKYKEQAHQIKGAFRSLAKDTDYKTSEEAVDSIPFSRIVRDPFSSKETSLCQDVFDAQASYIEALTVNTKVDLLPPSASAQKIFDTIRDTLIEVYIDAETLHSKTVLQTACSDIVKRIKAEIKAEAKSENTKHSISIKLQDDIRRFINDLPPDEALKSLSYLLRRFVQKKQSSAEETLNKIAEPFFSKPGDKMDYRPKPALLAKAKQEDSDVRIEHYKKSIRKPLTQKPPQSTTCCCCLFGFLRKRSYEKDKYHLEPYEVNTPAGILKKQ